MAWVRRGGHGTSRSGDAVVWSVAEGTRGTRWRESVTREGSILHSLLLEVTPEGRISRLESTTVTGLLTLHPEPDESALHGNVVTRDGIRHLALPWSDRHGLLVAASPVSAAVLARSLERSETSPAGSNPIGAAPIVWIDDDLDPRSGRWFAGRDGAGRWELRSADSDLRVVIGEVGSGDPALDLAQAWPLE